MYEYEVTGVRAGKVVRFDRRWPGVFVTARRLRTLGWQVSVRRRKPLLA